MIMVFIDCDHSCLIYSASFEFDVLLEVFFFWEFFETEQISGLLM